MTADPGRSGGEGTGLMGWHRHGPRLHQGDADLCSAAPDGVPVIILDPVTARDTIARALGEHRDKNHWTEAGYVNQCSCGWRDTRRPACTNEHIAEVVLAALASQERGE